MTAKRRKKVTIYRGSKTHGCGSMKKRRGAGNRGGRGMAGSGKRGDAKKPMIWKQKKYFGVHGFKKKNKKPSVSINLRTIGEKLDTWVKDGKAESKNGEYRVDLEQMGYDKLTGAGTISAKLAIRVGRTTDKAMKRVSEAGGNVELIDDGKASEGNKIQDGTREQKEESQQPEKDAQA
ncbi:MAG: uL15 family ribosomal protein [Candidatus Woesearchaeota archaeon]